MADATYKVMGLASKKKGKMGDGDLQQQHQNDNVRGEKEKCSDKQRSDDYYDDRLSRDSQLDPHLKELVSDSAECSDFGGISAGLFSAHEEEDSVVEDEFYEETREADDRGAQPVEAAMTGEITSPAEM